MRFRMVSEKAGSSICDLLNLGQIQIFTVVSGVLLPMLKKKLFILYLLAATSLACLTNTTVSQIPTPRPTRTSVPTFTVTPLPPTATPVPTVTETPLPTDTPAPEPTQDVAEVEAVEAAVNDEAGAVSDNETPSTETPVPPTNTPQPVAAQPTQPPPPPPTATPAPSPTPVANSPLPTPTNTPELGTPNGRYEELEIDGEENCADIGVYGRVEEKSNDQPIPHVMIEVVRDDDEDDFDDFQGPFTAKTDENGDYSIYVGPIDDAGGIRLKARVVGGPGVISEDEPEWETSSDCDDGIQVMEIDWGRKD